MNKCCNNAMVQSQLINGDKVKPQEKVIHKKYILTCPYTTFTKFDIIRWYLKHWSIYIYIMDVIHSLFEGLFIHLKFTIFKLHNTCYMHTLVESPFISRKPLYSICCFMWMCTAYVTMDGVLLCWKWPKNQNWRHKHKIYLQHNNSGSWRLCSHQITWTF